MPEFAVVHEKPRTFYGRYERKAELQEHTHYCPGAGMGSRTSCWPGRWTNSGFRIGLF